MSPCRPIIAFAMSLLAATCAQASGPSPDCPQTTSALYARIGSVGLDPQRVFHIRGATIDRPNLHLDFDDGKLVFTEDICGRITGAFFEGEGEIRLRPPNHVERGSLALFTGMAILEEQFTSAYLRFNDDTPAVLQPFLSPAADGTDFVKNLGSSGRTLAEYDGLRLFLDFSHFLPVSGRERLAPAAAQAAGRAEPPGVPDSETTQFPSFLHAHLLGKKLGKFEVF